MNDLTCSKCDAAFVPENKEQKARGICNVCISSKGQKKASRKPGNGLKKGSDSGGETRK